MLLHRTIHFIEIYQNCNIFNDGAFSNLTDRDTKADKLLYLENGEPMIFGNDKNKGIILDGSKPKVVEIGKNHSVDDILVHDETDTLLANMLSDFTASPDFPEPLGVLYCSERPTYDDLMSEQMLNAKEQSSQNLDDMLNAGDTWEVK